MTRIGNVLHVMCSDRFSAIIVYEACKEVWANRVGKVGKVGKVLSRDWRSRALRKEVQITA